MVDAVVPLSHTSSMTTATASPDLRFPIGKFHYEGPYSEPQRRKLIEEIEAAPRELRAAVARLTDTQLDTPYRPGGWTVRQVVHHVPESHMNSYIRFKLALTEDEPTIKPYDEDAWSKTAEVHATPLEISLTLLECLHYRWVALLRSMTVQEFQRKFRHPDLGVMDLERTLALYAWHGKHHVAHITSLRQRSGW